MKNLLAMSPTEFIEYSESRKSKAKENPNIPVIVRAGLYYMVDSNHTLWIIEHCTKYDGFTITEWHYGEESDTHANQHFTLKECIEAIVNNKPESKIEYSLSFEKELDSGELDLSEVFSTGSKKQMIEKLATIDPHDLYQYVVFIRDSESDETIEHEKADYWFDTNSDIPNFVELADDYGIRNSKMVKEICDHKLVKYNYKDYIYWTGKEIVVVRNDTTLSSGYWGKYSISDRKEYFSYISEVKAYLKNITV